MPYRFPDLSQEHTLFPGTVQNGFEETPNELGFCSRHGFFEADSSFRTHLRTRKVHLQNTMFSFGSALVMY